MIHTDNGQQVAIDYNINCISNRHDLQCFELLGSGDRTLTVSDRARGFYETKGFFCSFVFQRLSVLHTLFLENEAQTNEINYGTMSKNHT